jgi:VanZ family protein
VAWIGIIFFSSTSAALYYCVTAYHAVTAFIFGPNRHTPPFSFLQLLADKGLHVTLFFILALLLWQAVPPVPRRPWLILLGGLCVGSASEYLQSFFPDRDPAIHDVLINLGGTALGLGARLALGRKS